MPPRGTPELKLQGTVAFAPVSNLGAQAQALPALNSPSGLSGLAAMIIRGADIAKPSLGIQNLLSDQAEDRPPAADLDVVGMGAQGEDAPGPSPLEQPDRLHEDGSSSSPLPAGAQRRLRACISAAVIGLKPRAIARFCRSTASESMPLIVVATGRLMA